MNEKRLIVISAVPLVSVSLLLILGAGATSFLAGIVLTFLTETIWNYAEKKKGAQP